GAEYLVGLLHDDAASRVFCLPCTASSFGDAQLWSIASRYRARRLAWNPRGGEASFFIAFEAEERLFDTVTIQLHRAWQRTVQFGSEVVRAGQATFEGAGTMSDATAWSGASLQPSNRTSMSANTRMINLVDLPLIHR